MWAKGPLSPGKKAMGSQEGKSCRKTKGSALFLSPRPSSELVFSVVVFFIKDGWGLVWEMALPSTRSLVTKYKS